MWFQMHHAGEVCRDTARIATQSQPDLSPLFTVYLLDRTLILDLVGLDTGSSSTISSDSTSTTAHVNASLISAGFDVYTQ